MAEKKTIILQLLKILQEETDRDHIIDATKLGERLECNRKTVYANVEALRDFGIDIEQVKGSNPGYYIEERDFALPELKLLVDAVQASKFITTRRSEELIGKLEKLTNRDNARLLHRDVFIYNRPKTANQGIFNNVDFIHTAMREGKRIGFQYCEWNVKKQLVPRHAGERYDVSPWSLTWDDENYYLVGFDEKDQKIKHYRVDKMQHMSMIEQPRSGKETFEHFDLGAYSKKTFGMYGGRDADVTLRCENRLIGVILDRFGTETMIVPDGPDAFRAHVLVSVSPQFYGWVTGIGAGIRIEGPADVKREYAEHLAGVLQWYEEA